MREETRRDLTARRGAAHEEAGSSGRNECVADDRHTAVGLADRSIASFELYQHRVGAAVSLMLSDALLLADRSRALRIPLVSFDDESKIKVGGEEGRTRRAREAREARVRCARRGRVPSVHVAMAGGGGARTARGRARSIGRGGGASMFAFLAACTWWGSRRRQQGDCLCSGTAASFVAPGLLSTNSSPPPERRPSCERPTHSPSTPCLPSYAVCTPPLFLAAAPFSPTPAAGVLRAMTPTPTTPTRRR